jgi:hypothetical protein
MRPLLRLTELEVRTIWLNVANGVGDHGSFLRAFGRAVGAADHANFKGLAASSLYFIEKYDLNQEVYLKME